MMTFKITPHATRQVEMVEVFVNGRFVAAIYPHAVGLHIVSKHLTEVVMDPPSFIGLSSNVLLKLAPEALHD